MRFYALKKYPSGSAETEASEEKGHCRGSAAVCPACGAFVGMLEWLPPFRVELELFGTQFGDLVFMVGSDDFLVSEKFRGMYQQAGLTGSDAFAPVEVLRVQPRRKMSGQPPKYYRVCANYGRTALDLAASGVEWLDQPTCSECYSAHLVRWKCLVIKPGTWTGEDIFRPRGMPGETIVSQRFKDACEASGIRNAVFEPAETSGHDFYSGKVVPQFKAPQ